MSSAQSKFQQHCAEGVRAFVQTALVIDDEAYLRPPDDHPSIQSKPKKATAPVVSILKETGAHRDQSEPNSENTQSPDDEQAASDSESEIQQGPTAEDSQDDVTDSDNQAHDLNAKKLTDAFHEIDVTCGLYRPTPEENTVDLATRAAQHVDIVILDWCLLGNENSQIALEIVRGILDSDRKQNGRLRLIAVYTGEPDLASLAKELFMHLEADKELGGYCELTDTDVQSKRGDLRICFFNKELAPRAEPTSVASEEELPERLMQEFMKLTVGVLPTYALFSVAAVRRAAHHLIAVFHRGLDEAYIAHRCLLPHPDDARNFAAELIAAELRNVISMNEPAGRTLSADALGDWVDDLSPEAIKAFNLTDNCTVDDVKQFIRGGRSAITDGRSNGVSKKIMNESFGWFHESDEQTRKQCMEFARLSSFKRETTERTNFPDTWRPALSLGTVLKVRPANEEELTGSANGAPPAYLVCVQPSCDCVRVPGSRAFPFQTAEPSTTEDFNLIVGDSEGNGYALMVGWKPYQAVMITFDSDKETGSVLAKRENGPTFVFSDSNEKEYLWIGDIKELNAQRYVSSLASRLHTAGVDEFEWLRRGKLAPKQK